MLMRRFLQETAKRKTAYRLVSSGFVEASDVSEEPVASYPLGIGGSTSGV
jgi:hypothetical protein